MPRLDPLPRRAPALVRTPAQVAGFCALLLLPASGTAQEAPSLLSLLPAEGRSLTVGGEAPGELRPSDHVDVDGNHLQAWELVGRAGQTVAVELLSDPLDPYLRIVGPGLDGGLEDDDGGDGLNSRLCLEFPTSGSYTVVASALGRETGAFTLRVRELQDAASCADDGYGEHFSPDDWEDDEEILRELPLTGTLTPGRPVEGRLESDDPLFLGAHVQAWALEGREGRSMAVDLESEELDAYLLFLGPGFESYVVDDDGGEGLDSRLCVVFPETGTYRVVASSIAEREGSYRLTATVVPGPGEPGGCDDYQLSTARLLRDLATDDRILRRGEVASSSLDPDDSRDPRDGGPLEVWTLDAEAGRRVVLEMVSREFDTYLSLAGPGIDGALDDDDGAGACNARVDFTPSESGTYFVGAGSFSGDAAGGYELRVTSEPGPDHDGPCPGSDVDWMDADPDPGPGGVTAGDLEALPSPEPVEPGYEREGVLADDDPGLDGGYADAWELRGSAGMRLVVELVSDAFDPYLYLTGPGLGLLSDDDGAGDRNSRIEVTLPESGVYRIVATSYIDRATGAYRLRVLRSR